MIYFGPVMKYLNLFIIVLFFSLSCEKPDDEDNTPITPIDIKPKVAAVINDSTIIITWPKFRGKRFNRYVIEREAYYLKNGKVDWHRERIDSSTDVNDTIFYERKMPVSRGYTYHTYAETVDHYLLSRGFVIYERPMYTFIYGEPTESLLDKQNKLIYVPQPYRRKFFVIDYTTGIFKKEADVGDISGRCGMGEYNGIKEIYIPYYYGVKIFDAASLNYKETIASGQAYSVTAHNGKLYISTSDTAGGKKECVKVFDRATKQLLAQTGYGDVPSLLPLPGASNEMIGIRSDPRNWQTTYFSYYQFNNTGNLISQNQYTHPNTYLANAEGILRAFPDGNRFIAGCFGIVLTKSLTFEGYLNKKGYYLDYEFNDDGSLIYAADTDNKEIDVISYPSGTVIKSYPTTLYPFRIYRDGNSLICLNGASGVWTNPFNFIVQKIEL
jgi:hypothetical protein